MAAAAVGMLAAMLTAHPAVATPDPGDAPPAVEDVTPAERAEVEAAIEKGEIPGKGEIVTSDNVRHLSTTPKAAIQGTNSDLAFRGKYAFAGNYDGFVVYDISKPKKPRIVSQVLCPGGQGDITVNGNLLVFSVDSSRSDDSCHSTAQPATEKSSWEGIRVFDVSDVTKPRYVAAVETACGAHTHTVVPDKKDLFVYVSSYFPDETFPDCQPPHDGISIVKVPKKSPHKAELVRFAGLFPDGGFEGAPGKSETTGCHDITAYPKLKLAAGACMGDGILLDISKPAKPKVVERVRDEENFAFWHSATFSNDGSKVVFTDELGGGVSATCNAEVGGEKGANAIYHLKGKGKKAELRHQSYYKIPRHQADTENCVAHNGSLIPVKGRDIMVQSWYQGGVSIWDFTNSKKPKEIGYFERGPENTEDLSFGGTWSAYYYNGHIYSNDQNGFDVLEIRDKRTDGAKKVRLDEFNPQTQPHIR